jgi:hypothetical protein
MSKSQIESLRSQLVSVVTALSDADLLATLREARAERVSRHIVTALVAEVKVRKLQCGE